MSFMLKDIMLNETNYFKQTPGALTIIGMAKNVGKTVTLNYVQKVLHTQQFVLGLTSIGRDGESFDALTHLAKPSIVVQPQTIVATAEKLVVDPSAWEYLQDTDISTPLGKVVVLKARSVNKVVLAGPSKNQEVKEILQYLIHWGAECILIDGAFDRQSSADPLISNKVILATGATLNRDVNQLVRITKCRVEQLTIPACNNEYRKLYEKSKAKIVNVNDGQWQESFVDTSLLCEAEWLAILEHGCSVLMVKGAVGDGLAQALLKKQPMPEVIIQDGSKIFITVNLWQQLKARNINIQAVQAISLLAVTINPTYPGGEGIQPDLLLREMGIALAPIPVMNVVQEVKFQH